MRGEAAGDSPHQAVVPECANPRWTERVLSSLLGRSKLDFVLVAAVVIGTLLRVWQFGVIPPGLNQDEASTAYDAFCLAHHGVDRHGFWLPMMLVSWGSGMYALASYVEAPFIRLFGLSVSSARLPFLLVGIAAIPLLYSLLRDTIGRRAARLGAVFLAVCPWHIMVSRWALDSNLLPFVVLASAALFARSLENPKRLFLASAVLGLGLYAYGTAYVAVPAFLVLTLGYGLRHRVWRLRTVFLSATAFGIVALPVGLYLLVNSLGWDSLRTPFFSVPKLTGVPRYKTMGNLDVFSVSFFERAAKNLSTAATLFRSQDDDLIWNAIPKHGILYWFSPLLAAIGLASLAARSFRRHFESSFILLAWCAASIVLLAFVDANINRANVTMIPFVYCAAIGADVLWQHRHLAILLSVLLIFSVSSFVGSYFGSYRRQAAPAFFTSFGEALQEAAHRTQGPICVTPSVNMPYIFALFYNQEDPASFRRTVQYENPGAEFQNVISFGRYRFDFPSCAESSQALVLTPDEARDFAEAEFSRKTFERYTVLVRRKRSNPTDAPR